MIAHNFWNKGGNLIVALCLCLSLNLLLAVTTAFAQDVRIKHKDPAFDRDLILNGSLELAEGKSLADGVVLMTHGTGGYNKMEIMATLQELLAERGLSSLAITLSMGIDDRQDMINCPKQHWHKHTDALDEIGAWIDWLKTNGTTKVVLLGHSRGGNQTAWFIAERDRPEVKGTVLLAPMTWTYETVAKRYNDGAPRKLDDVMAEMRASDPRTVVEGLRFLTCGEAAVSAGSFLSYYEDEPRRDTPTLLPKITKPTLVIAGSEDTLVPDLPARKDSFVDDDTQLIVIDGADHFFRDLYADDVADAIEEFLTPHF